MIELLSFCAVLQEDYTVEFVPLDEQNITITDISKLTLLVVCYIVSRFQSNAGAFGTSELPCTFRRKCFIGKLFTHC